MTVGAQSLSEGPRGLICLMKACLAMIHFSAECSIHISQLLASLTKNQLGFASALIIDCLCYKHVSERD